MHWDYIFISNIMQELLQETKILLSISSNHFPVLFFYNKSFQMTLSRNFWEFNSSLAQDKTHILKMKEDIKHVKTSLTLNFKNL